MTKIEPVSRSRISNIEQAAAGIIGNKKVSAARAAVHSEQVLHSLKRTHELLKHHLFADNRFPYTLARASRGLSILYLVLNCIIPGPKIVNRKFLVAVNAIIVEQSLANLSSFRCKTATVTVTSRKRRRTNAKRTPTAT